MTACDNSEASDSANVRDSVNGSNGLHEPCLIACSLEGCFRSVKSPRASRRFLPPKGRSSKFERELKFAQPLLRGAQLYKVQSDCMHNNILKNRRLNHCYLLEKPSATASASKSERHRS